MGATSERLHTHPSSPPGDSSWHSSPVASRHLLPRLPPPQGQQCQGCHHSWLVTPRAFPTPDIVSRGPVPRSSLPCFPRTAFLILPDGNAKALQRFVKFMGSLSPPQRPPCHIQQCQTACPWPWAALCTSKHRWTIYHILSPLQSHRAESHMLLSVVKAQGLLTPHAQSGGSGCGVLKRKSHSKILHNTPGAMPSR